MPQDGTRCGGRIPKQIAIALIGSDIEGRVFAEQTTTVVLSRNGAGIVSVNKLSAEQEVVIRNEESRKETDARVVGQIGSDGDRYIYGIAFLEPSINFWGMTFPELSQAEKLAGQILLECSGCHSRVTVDHNDLASDVMAVNQNVVRYCRRCLSSTLWTQAGQTSKPSEDAPRLPDPPVPPASGSSSLETGQPMPAAKKVPTRGFASSPWTHAETSPGSAAWAPSASSASANEVETAESPATPVTVPESSRPAITKTEQENRRKHARTRVNFKACVRRPGMPDDIVACEDMSRGGLRFKSSKEYFEKTLIDVAVPYASGDQAIFVPGRIAYVQELCEQKLYRCGVMYLRSAR